MDNVPTMQTIYYTLAIIAILLAAHFATIEWRLRGIFVTRKEMDLRFADTMESFKEALKEERRTCNDALIAERRTSDSRWDQHLKWGDDVASGIQRQIVVLEKLIEGLHSDVRAVQSIKLGGG